MLTTFEDSASWSHQLTPVPAELHHLDGADSLAAFALQQYLQQQQISFATDVPQIDAATLLSLLTPTIPPACVG